MMETMRQRNRPQHKTEHEHTLHIKCAILLLPEDFGTLNVG